MAHILVNLAGIGVGAGYAGEITGECVDNAGNVEVKDSVAWQSDIDNATIVVEGIFAVGSQDAGEGNRPAIVIDCYLPIERIF